jgi:hypothetical protein
LESCFREWCIRWACLAYRTTLKGNVFIDKSKLAGFEEPASLLLSRKGNLA